MLEWFWTPFLTKQLHKCLMNQAGFTLASWSQETNQHTPRCERSLPSTMSLSLCHSHGLGLSLPEQAQCLCFRICDTGPSKFALGDTQWRRKNVSFQLIVLSSFLSHVGFREAPIRRHGRKRRYESLANIAEPNISDWRPASCREEQ